MAPFLPDRSFGVGAFLSGHQTSPALMIWDGGMSRAVGAASKAEVMGRRGRGGPCSPGSAGSWPRQDPKSGRRILYFPGSKCSQGGWEKLPVFIRSEQFIVSWVMGVFTPLCMSLCSIPSWGPAGAILDLAQTQPMQRRAAHVFIPIRL